LVYTNNMKTKTLRLVIASRLEDLANQVEKHVAEGNYDAAELLREEGLELAAYHDNEETFLYMDDFTNA
jgi:hypothetical protein